MNCSNFWRSKMTMKAYSKETKLKVKKLLEEHVKEVRTNIPWTGENDLVTKKIMKLFK